MRMVFLVIVMVGALVEVGENVETEGHMNGTTEKNSSSCKCVIDCVQ
ncbi:hypothetical protein PC116_g2200 [Phytophthora cactorum]|nr:hypothetical protein PC116_g2200 [Phytophthora cactorum]